MLGQNFGTVAAANLVSEEGGKEIMPSASSKPRPGSPQEHQNALQQVLNIVEKKVRNLEKRKQKLDGYRELAKKGEELNKDQLEAAAKYDEVTQCLELTNDFMKQFLTINAETQKLVKKAEKRQLLAQREVELKRVQDLLEIQHVLDLLGTDTVREDFKQGKPGAVPLTEAQLTQLDELYKVINPEAEEGTSFGSQQADASEHVLCLLDARDKEIAGTTYKDLRELLQEVVNCPYWDNTHAQPEPPAENGPAQEEQQEEEEEEVEEEAPPQQVPPQEEFVAVETEDITTVEETEVLKTSLVFERRVQEPLAPEPPQEPLLPNQTSASMADSMFAMTAAQQAMVVVRPQRSLDEVLATVQGSFNFMQESLIDREKQSQQTGYPPQAPAQVPQAPRTITPPPTATTTQTQTNQTLYGQSYTGNAQLGQTSNNQYSSNSYGQSSSQYNAQNSQYNSQQSQYGSSTANSQYSSQQTSTNYQTSSSTQYGSQAVAGTQYGGQTGLTQMSNQQYNSQQWGVDTSSHTDQSLGKLGSSSLGSQSQGLSDHSLGNIGSSYNPPPTIPLPNDQSTMQTSQSYGLQDSSQAGQLSYTGHEASKMAALNDNNRIPLPNETPTIPMPNQNDVQVPKSSAGTNVNAAPFQSTMASYSMQGGENPQQMSPPQGQQYPAQTEQFGDATVTTGDSGGFQQSGLMTSQQHYRNQQPFQNRGGRGGRGSRGNSASFRGRGGMNGRGNARFNSAFTGFYQNSNPGYQGGFRGDQTFPNTYGQDQQRSYTRPQDGFPRGGRGGIGPRGAPRGAIAVGGRGGMRGMGSPRGGRGGFSKPPSSQPGAASPPQPQAVA
ncbi:caprin-1-like isoform X3 [Branchiostoma lanceolatum]|uniref:caprin-1-like isoform X3 n=1 Tax=Branchiostoma lanceolatum TaxID=7740 RepID=UPI003456DD17